MARILLLNPNTTEAVTELLMTAGKAVVSAEHELIAMTACRGVPYIASRAEAQIGGAIALEMLAEQASGCDAAIIAAFGDPGLHGARELFDFPVVGLAEAAMLTACMLGRRFAIVTFAEALGPWYEDCVAMHGLEGRCAGVRMLDGSFASVADVQSEKADLLVGLAARTIAETAADAIILGGAPLAGLAGKVRNRIPVPLVDPVQAAVKQVEALLALQARKASVGTFRRPAAKPSIGLTSALARRIAHED